MSTLFWILSIGFIVFFMILLYALCRTSSDADREAGYMEEYSEDLDDDFMD